MGTLHTVSAPPPSLYVTGDRSPVTSAYFAVTVDAAVDLLEARDYRNLPRSERVSKAHAEQQAFLNGFFDPGLRAALDLRIAANPSASTPVSVALLGRVWDASAGEATARAEGLRRQVHDALPRHVTATVVEDADDVARLLTPFTAGPVDSAVITRHELIGVPSRPDAGVSYYYSAAPFTASGNDWSAVYAALAASTVPVVVSVAVLPMLVPAQFAQTLLTLATYYGRLAREGDPEAGPYRGRARFAPDAFAVDAEKAFHDFARRLSRQAFALRIQVSAARQLPPGIVDTIGSAIAGAMSPAERGGSLLEHELPVPAYDVRRPASAAERRLAEYNLNVINFGMLTGRQEIWGRHDPPDPQLALLSVLGDARDACCAFRLPVAADGVVPGFRVRRGLLGQAGARELDGPAVRLGEVSGASRGAAVPLRSLTRHALIAGSAGSGKTVTALEILRQLWADHRVPFLVIDHSGAREYRELAGEPGFESLEVITAGDEASAPLRFNPLEAPAGVLVGEHAANLLACFTAAFGLCGPLPSLYRDALSLTYLRAGFLPVERPADGKRTWPTVVELRAALGEVTRDLGYTGDVKASIDAASVRRARQLACGTAGSVFLTDRPADIGRLLDHPVIVELGSLGAGDDQALMMALLLNAITEHCRSVRGASADLVHVTLVEEGGRLLGRAVGGQPADEARAREQAAGALATTLADSGRYGEGLIITARFPVRLVADVVKSCGLKIVHRLTAADDRRYLGEILGTGILGAGEARGLSEAQGLSEAGLRTGEARVWSDEPAEVTQVSIARTRQATAPRPGMVRASAAPPFAACDRCRAQCAYRGAALSMTNDPAIVTGITGAASGLARPGSTPAERQAGLAGLRGTLYHALGRFPALPAADPWRGDAAYCLLLHVCASNGTVRADGLLQAAGDSLLQAVVDIEERSPDE